MKKGEKMSEEQKKKVSESNKKTFSIKGPYFQAFGNNNPACRPEVREKISKTVKDLWSSGIYIKRKNGMLGKYKFEHPNYSPETEKKYQFRKFVQQKQALVCSNPFCDASGRERKIDVHHIDENHTNWLLTNLEPLCNVCHQKFHLERYIQPYVTIGKIFVMECCHNLEFYDGKCQRSHGHSYHLEVQVKKRINPESGMVMDFGDIKKLVNKFVIEELDHYNLNDKLPFQTTAENILFWIWKQLEEKALIKGLSKISLWETENSIALITSEDVLNYKRSLLYAQKDNIIQKELEAEK